MNIRLSNVVVAFVDWNLFQAFHGTQASVYARSPSWTGDLLRCCPATLHQWLVEVSGKILLTFRPFFSYFSNV